MIMAGLNNSLLILMICPLTFNRTITNQRDCLCLQEPNLYKFCFPIFSMPKKDGDDYVISETGNWNVADQYTKSKIMRPLNLCDYYEDIARFGYESIAEELINYQAPPNDVIRIKAIKRLILELIRLIDNSKFALKKSGTKQTILEYKGLLKKILPLIPQVVHISKNDIEGTTQVTISKPALFEEILEKISGIKSKINEPLNQNHLIFTDTEEFDPVAFKKGLKDRMVNRG